MFNSNLQYYWAWIPGLDVLAERASGENPFSRKFVDALEKGDVEFIVGKDDWIFASLPVSARSYVQEKYSYKDCLWTRK